MLEKFIENWTSRLDYIRASRGSPMPEIIFKIALVTMIYPSRVTETPKRGKLDPQSSFVSCSTFSVDEKSCHTNGYPGRKGWYIKKLRNEDPVYLSRVSTSSLLERRSLLASQLRYRPETPPLKSQKMRHLRRISKLGVILRYTSPVNFPVLDGSGVKERATPLITPILWCIGRPHGLDSIVLPMSSSNT
ncbi:hypothetical protein TNCV_738691 [Trichonephila clavipes]|nr:hypothetical protein TNCV_738691 [Trichonephila clavipes]